MTNKTKIYVGERYHGQFTCDGRKLTRMQAIGEQVVRATKGTLKVTAYFLLAVWISMGGFWYGKSEVKTKTIWAETIKEVPVKEIPPVLKRIAKCESGDMHYKNGQVIFNANSNGTVDRGRYQINSVWDKKATELGLDLSNEKDNEQFAMWLYENRGSEDWYSSKSCWNR